VTPEYAADTKVPAQRSRQEIETVLGKFGATAFGFMATPESNQIAFRFEDRAIRFTLPLPARDDHAFTHTPTGIRRSAAQQQVTYEQAIRQTWRALLLIVKAKLEAIRAGVATFDEEFYAYTVLPTGNTIYEETSTQVEEMIASGRPTRLMLDR
jgi:hypothetical protein